MAQGLKVQRFRGQGFKGSRFKVQGSKVYRIVKSEL